MKPVQHGRKFQITYRCPNYPKPFFEVFDTLEEANLRIAQIELEKKRGTLVPPTSALCADQDYTRYRETITVNQLFEEYVNLYGLNHWSEGTLSCNQHRINDYILPYIGDIRVKALTTRRLEQFYLQLLVTPAVKLKGREDEENTISHSVVEKIHCLMRSALNQAIRWDYLRGSNPALAAEIPRVKKEKRDAWNDHEALHALRLCSDPALKLCMFLSLGCSMRIGEILGLTWDCVNIDPDLIEANRACLRVEKELRRCERESITKLQELGRSDIFWGSTAQCHESGWREKLCQKKAQTRRNALCLSRGCNAFLVQFCRQPPKWYCAMLP